MAIVLIRDLVAIENNLAERQANSYYLYGGEYAL